MRYRQISTTLARKIVDAEMGTMRLTQHDVEYVIPRRNGVLVLEASEDHESAGFQWQYFISRRTA